MELLFLSVTLVRQHSPREIPHFIGEVPGLLDALWSEPDVLLVSAPSGHQSIPKRIGAVLLDEVEGINAGAQRFAHPLAMLVQDRGVDENNREGGLTHKLEPCHDHPRDPEIEDLAR